MFGQYSNGTGRHTKADQVGYATEQGYEVAKAARAGHNRLWFETTDGRQGFMLHKTVIGELSADGQHVTLNDGGWATMTTRRAMDEALSRFILPWRVWADHGGHTVNGHRFDRTITLDIPTGKPTATSADPYLIRSDVGEGEYAAIKVTYDGRHIRSTGLPGEEIGASPVVAIAQLRHVLVAIKPHRDKVTAYWFRTREPIDCGTSIFGFDIGVNGFGRYTFIGCHAFKTADLRAILRRLEADYPEAAAKSRRDGSLKPRKGRLSNAA